MNNETVKVYAAQADKRERDPISVDMGRATMPMSQGFAKWRRFNPGGELIWVVTPEGKDAWLTRKQADLLDLSLSYIDKGVVTIRSLALELKCSPSTISRGLVKLASLGLLAALIGRGRYAGALIFRLPKDGSLDRFRRAAKDKVRRWAKCSAERVSRLKFNVASRYSWKEIESHGYDFVYVDVMDATMKRPWTPEDLREAGII